MFLSKLEKFLNCQNFEDLWNYSHINGNSNVFLILVDKINASNYSENNSLKDEDYLDIWIVERIIEGKIMKKSKEKLREIWRLLCESERGSRK